MEEAPEEENSGWRSPLRSKEEEEAPGVKADLPEVKAEAQAPGEAPEGKAEAQAAASVREKATAALEKAAEAHAGERPLSPGSASMAAIKAKGAAAMAAFEASMEAKRPAHRAANEKAAKDAAEGRGGAGQFEDLPKPQAPGEAPGVAMQVKKAAKLRVPKQDKPKHTDTLQPLGREATLVDTPAAAPAAAPEEKKKRPPRKRKKNTTPSLEKQVRVSQVFEISSAWLHHPQGKG